VLVTVTAAVTLFLPPGAVLCARVIKAVLETAR
jgi:hypothetical protein